MRKGDRRETVLGSGRNLPLFSYLVRGYARNASKGAFVFGNDMISANSKQYKIIDFNVVHYTGGSYLEFRVEGGRLGNDATVNIDGRDNPVVDAAWSPVYGTVKMFAGGGPPSTRYRPAVNLRTRPLVERCCVDVDAGAHRG